MGSEIGVGDGGADHRHGFVVWLFEIFYVRPQYSFYVMQLYVSSNMVVRDSTSSYVQYLYRAR
jgi:hypothetical protein